MDGGDMKRLLLVLSFIIVFTFISSITFAATVILQWNPNTEEDLAGYKLYYGGASRLLQPYTVTIPIPDKTAITFSIELNPGTYFFALTAYDLASNESGYSNEVSTIIPEYPSKPESPIIITIQ
jgi:hypothetical protein